jgi:hypothetical protein
LRLTECTSKNGQRRAIALDQTTSISSKQIRGMHCMPA